MDAIVIERKPYVTAEQAVRDGRLVTGQTWQSHPEFYRLVFECLSTVPHASVAGAAQSS